MRERRLNKDECDRLEYSPEPDKIVEWVEEAYQATDRLMQDLQMRDSAT